MKTADKLHSLIWGDITHIFTDVPMLQKDADDLSNSIYGRIETAIKEHDNEIKALIDEIDITSFKGIEDQSRYYEGWHEALTELRSKI